MALIVSETVNAHFLIFCQLKGNWTKKLYAFSQSAKFDNQNVSQTSQKSVVRVNMRTKMSSLFNSGGGGGSGGGSVGSNLFEGSEPNLLFNQQQCKQHKAVSFVPQSDLLLQSDVFIFHTFFLCFK